LVVHAPAANPAARPNVIARIVLFIDASLGVGPTQLHDQNKVRPHFGAFSAVNAVISPFKLTIT
jgi:hypothetical protein